MTKFVIRSMTTTDYVAASHDRPVQLPQPYHIYLRKPEYRVRAYWCRACNEVQVFDSIAEAQAEIDRTFPKTESYEPLLDIVPQNDSKVPTFWDARSKEKGARPGRNRVIDNTIVFVER